MGYAEDQEKFINDLATKPELFENFTKIIEKSVSLFTVKLEEDMKKRRASRVMEAGDGFFCQCPEDTARARKEQRKFTVYQDAELMECLPWLKDEDIKELKKRAYTNKIDELNIALDNLNPLK